MRSVFPAFFRPTTAGYEELWKSCTFSVDANVLLNLYRYSPETRKELEVALGSIQDRIFLTHQAAKEFLRNRLTVTAAQAEEYTKAIRALSDLAATISNKKKHPFLPSGQQAPFTSMVEGTTSQLEAQREALLARLINDEILDFTEGLFEGKTGGPLSGEQMNALPAEGDTRYQNDVPPGYKDGKKDSSGDPNRKYGDLIVWKQLIALAKSNSCPVIFVTDDQKEDWWLEQSGRTIGPRIELREEFQREANQEFWMYTVDKFIEESARYRQAEVSEEVIAEILEVREEANTQRLERSNPNRFRSISREDFLERLENSERWAAENSDGFLGLVSYVKSYLGNAGYDYGSSFELIRQLESEGVVEIYDHQGLGHDHSVKAIRLSKPRGYSNRPLEGLKSILRNAEAEGGGSDS